MGQLNNIKSILEDKSLALIFTIIGIGFFYDINIYYRILQILGVVILLFSPYLIYVLYIHQKRKWITGLVVWMAVSFLPWLVMDRSDSMGSLISISVPVLFFLFYCWFLNQHINEWLFAPQRNGEV